MSYLFPTFMAAMNTPASGPLTCDLITPQPQFALGFRRLFEDYEGECARLRNSSSGVATDIGFSDNYFDSGEYETWIGGDSARIITIYDQVASADMGVTTSTDGPDIAVASFDSDKYAPSFNGTSHVMYNDLGASALDMDDSTTFFVWKRNGVGNWAAWSAASNLGHINNTAGITSASYSRAQYGGKSVSANWASGTATRLHVLTFRNTGSTIYAYIDDTVVASAAYTGSADNRRYFIIGTLRESPWFAGCGGEFLEVIHYNEDLSDSDRETIRDDIINYYGI